VLGRESLELGDRAVVVSDRHERRRSVLLGRCSALVQTRRLRHRPPFVGELTERRTLPEVERSAVPFDRRVGK
jgi:hypothetical protein